MQSHDSSTTGFKAVIVGAGVAGLEAALALRDLAGERVSVTVLAPDEEYVDRPTTVREPFAAAAAHRYPLDDLLRGIGADHCVDTFKWIDPAARVIHTDGGVELGYDAALLAVGARRVATLPNALTLDDRQLDEQLHGLVQDIEEGYVKSIAFAMPSTNCWPLPAYELALMTANRAHQMNVDVRVTLITAETRPLIVFGAAVSEAVSEMFAESGIEIVCAPDAQTRDRLLTPDPGGEREFDRIVAVPQLFGASLPGAPATAHDGFLSVDRHARVSGVEHLYAAGDTTDSPVKFGALAALQADAAAEAIAAEAGVPVDPEPVVPVVYGLLIGGRRPLYLKALVTDGRGQQSEVSDKPFVDTQAKLEAKYLRPYLDSLRERSGSGTSG